MTRRSTLLAMISILILSVLPSCSSSNSPEQIFETVWETFDQRYAIFDPKSVDWQALHEVYRPRVGPKTSDEELFEVLTDMMSHLNDNHVMLTAPSIGRDFSAGYLGRYLEDKGLAGAMEYLQSRPLPVLHDGPRSVGGGTFHYGLADEGIGYLHFGGFDDVAASAAAVDTILQELAGVRALIVDVRNNTGGDDRVGKAIADRFADRKRLYMITSDRNGPDHGDFAEPRYWHVDPAERTFTGPIALLTSRFSISAAENFALAMRVLPHVTVVGDTTSGCFADMEWHDLPNGWRFSVSRNLFVDYTGRCWEGIGVPPDVVLPGVHEDDEVDRALEKAVELLQGDGPPLQDESASVAAVRLNLIEVLAQDLESDGFKKARANFAQRKRDLQPGSWYAHARDFNALGYRMLADERFGDAISAFKLYVELFPEEFNAYDSLGEGFMKSGDVEQAIANYERSLELNPDNQNAVEMLKKLRGDV